MYTQSLLLALAGSVVATYTPQQLNRVRDLEAGIEARQDADDFQECQDSLSSVAGALPTPTGDLGSYLNDFYATANPTDPAVFCEITSSMPSSLRSEYTSYDEAASSWIDEYVSVMGELVSTCGGEDAAASALLELASAIESYTAADCAGTFPTDAAEITSLLPIAGGGVTAGPTPTGGDSPSETGSGGNGDREDSSDQDDSDSDNPPQNAAARSGGVIAGALALAGVVGVAAML